MLGVFIQNLYADAASVSSPSVGISAMIPWVLIFVVFYFLLIRPQQKKEKARLDMIKALKKGDKITTNGGIIGVVDKVEDNEVKVEIASGVVISVLKNFVVLSHNKSSVENAKKSEANSQPHKLKKNAALDRKNADNATKAKDHDDDIKIVEEDKNSVDKNKKSEE